MGKKEIDIEIDRLTNSIENSVTGDVLIRKLFDLVKQAKGDQACRMAFRLGRRIKFIRPRGLQVSYRQ